MNVLLPSKFHLRRCDDDADDDDEPFGSSFAHRAILSYRLAN